MSDNYRVGDEQQQRPKARDSACSLAFLTTPRRRARRRRGAAAVRKGCEDELAAAELTELQDTDVRNFRSLSALADGPGHVLKLDNTWRRVRRTGPGWGVGAGGEVGLWLLLWMLDVWLRHDFLNTAAEREARLQHLGGWKH